MAEERLTPELLTCKVCGRGPFSELRMHIVSAHKMTTHQYREKTGYKGPMFVRPSNVPEKIHKDRSRAGKASNAKWTPERILKLSESVKKSYNEDLRKRRSEATKAKWSDPIHYASRVASMRKSASYPDVRVSKSESQVARWEDGLTVFTQLRRDLHARARSRCENCGKTEKETLKSGGRRLHLHHRNYNKLVPGLEDVLLLCSSCHHTLHGDGKQRERLPMVTRSVGSLLKALGVSETDENFVETPRRFATHLLEHFSPISVLDELVEEFQGAMFPADYHDMMVCGGVRVDGMCPHHLLPVHYVIHMAYIPKEKVVGISKLARVADVCGKFPILQETLTGLIAAMLQKILGTESVAVLVQGKHLCMGIRGIKKPEAETVSSKVTGDFLDDLSTRNEFLNLVKGI